MVEVRGFGQQLPSFLIASAVRDKRAGGRPPPPHLGKNVKNLSKSELYSGTLLRQNKCWLVINKWQLNLSVSQKFQENLCPKAFLATLR